VGTTAGVRSVLIAALLALTGAPAALGGGPQALRVARPADVLATPNSPREE
jgi:hypothetical protein